MQVEIRGLPVHYLDEGTGRPVLMLHGRPGDHRLMRHMLEPAFAGREGWRRLYPDLPGMGETPGADWIRNQDDVLAVMLDFVDAVIPEQSFAVVGGSYGGYLALGVMHERQSRIDGLCLWSPAVTLQPDEAALPAHIIFEQSAEAVASVQPDEALWLQIAVVQTPATLAAFRAAVKPGLQSADHAFLERLEEPEAFSFDPTDLPEPMKRPSLILTGRQDTQVGYTDAVNLLELFPRATLAVLDRAGHGIAAEQEALFRGLIGDWLDRVEGEA
ncbi:MAG TPA: alpha/beta hydrolase [Candidatus Limnocylindria bacterium]